MYLSAHRDIFAFDSAVLQLQAPTRAAVVCTLYLFMLRSSIGCRAASRSNSFLIISVWRVIKKNNKKNNAVHFVPLINVVKRIWRSLRFFSFGHLKSWEVRRWQVTQVVLGGSVSSGLLLHQRCSLHDRRQFIFFCTGKQCSNQNIFRFSYLAFTLNIWKGCLFIVYVLNRTSLTESLH